MQFCVPQYERDTDVSDILAKGHENDKRTEACFI